MKSPSAVNSSSWAAVGAYAGPLALFERVNTKTWPLEFTATPGTSPKFIPSGSFGKSTTESKGICGTLCWARLCWVRHGVAISSRPAVISAFMETPPCFLSAYAAWLSTLSQQWPIKTTAAVRLLRTLQSSLLERAGGLVRLRLKSGIGDGSCLRGDTGGG